MAWMSVATLQRRLTLRSAGRILTTSATRLCTGTQRTQLLSRKSQSSAKSYIPEMTWNDSCANTGNATGCASGVASDGTDLVAGGGGPSNCATSTSASTARHGVTCTAGIPKPAWQTGTGVPNDGVRDTPDVSLFAGDGYHGSFYVFCEMDANTGTGSSTSSCDLNAPYLDFQGAGGTSFATPAFAGIIAMVNQKTGQRQGNANYVLYPLAAQTWRELWLELRRWLPMPAVLPVFSMICK